MITTCLKTLFLFIILSTPLVATHIFWGEDQLSIEEQEKLFDIILKGEPPRSFYQPTHFDFESECRKISPSLRFEWIPSSVWQLAVLHTFFHDAAIRDTIIGYSGVRWDPHQYDETFHSQLQQATNIEQVTSHFDTITKSIPKLCELYFKVNKKVAALYDRANQSDREMLHLIVSEMPPFQHWSEKQFPYLKCPWIYDVNATESLYHALKDEVFLDCLLKMEREAHEKNEWILYRGYPGSGFPSTLERGTNAGHALSFGSTLLGGVFFSTEAAALAYYKTRVEQPHSFLALRVTIEELKQLFRVGPLHPFVQLLVDGEIFHAHTKIAVDKTAHHVNTPLNGYFMRCNKYCNDPLGVILSFDHTPEEYERAFLSICERRGHLFPKPQE